MIRLHSTIRIKPVREVPGRAAQARVTGANPKEAPVSITVHINEPPQWLRRIERKAGIFSNMPLTLHLYLDHTDHWTDIQFGEHFTIFGLIKP